MYGRSRSDTAMPRTSRVYQGHQERTMAIIALRMLGPRNATNTMARISDGNARNTSQMRITTSSNLPPK